MVADYVFDTSYVHALITNISCIDAASNSSELVADFVQLVARDDVESAQHAMNAERFIAASLGQTPSPEKPRLTDEFGTPGAKKCKTLSTQISDDPT